MMNMRVTDQEWATVRAIPWVRAMAWAPVIPWAQAMVWVRALPWDRPRAWAPVMEWSMDMVLRLMDQSSHSLFMDNEIYPDKK